jgi:hypothetical protein
LGRLREPIRTRTFEFIRQALQTDDGRRILADALNGLLPAVPTNLDVAEGPSEYPELGRAAEARSRSPIFITGRFRSGSTLLWNVFRHIDGCKAYYEPLNERRWFDAAHRGTRVDPTHVGVEDYWAEYNGLEHLNRVFRNDWASRNLYMDEHHWDEDLATYIQALIDAAAPRRAVLQFNRVDFRLPWLRSWFPDAAVVHVYRHPRDQWCSSLMNVELFPARATLKDFPSQDHFYLLTWARDLRFRFPFLDEARVDHPYDLFYMIWKLSWWFGRRYAEHSVSFERLVESPESEIQKLLSAVGLTGASASDLGALVEGRSGGSWRRYADDGWFAQREARCEELLRRWLRLQSNSRSRAG